MALEHIRQLTCVACGRHYGTDTLYTCPSCGIEGILDVEYDVEKAARTLTPRALEGRPWSQWRYQELLPVDFSGSVPHLQVGMTPVYPTPRLAEAVGVKALWVKDDGRNPTGSFKDRASAVGVMKARELGKEVIACASTGNAASSLAGFSAATALRSFIFVPERAPEPKIAQLLIFGATVLRVRGTYDQAWDFCQRACARYGWYNRNCAVNPYLVEGKKTVGLELGERLGDEVPDWVVLSVGDGCTLAGAWKGLQQMHQLGFLKRLPRMLGVQAAGSAPITEAWQKKADAIQPTDAQTLADSICVGQPRNWRKALRAVRDSSGAMVNVEDAEILDAMRKTARLAAVFAEPAGATSVAGLAAAVRQGLVGKGETALCVVTGNGLKDIKSAIQATTPPIDLAPEMDALEAELKERRLI
ncbi:MAG TPA: threonine synthase [Myxococcales bacterium]|jgi:threonine synthase|nr:threonine synthase [Myxococcales bacterium]